MSADRLPWLGTIGYQGATLRSLVRALQRDDVRLVVDIRAVANSRRPGFSKTRLAANLAEGGIDYLHLRALGTPADGRAAARAGHDEEMRAIFLAHLATSDAQAALDDLAQLLRGERRVAVLCFEADPRHCHRSLVAGALEARFPLQVAHLFPELEAAD